MRIGIIVYSHTGNTYSVAESIKDRLTSLGHSVNIEKLTVENDEQTDTGKVAFKSIPEISGYDGVIFGAPVRGFSLHAAMKAFLSKILSIKGKKIACYVTEYFPYPWMGGKSSISQMTGILQTKGAQVLKTGIINWTHKRDNKIHALVEDMSRLF